MSDMRVCHGISNHCEHETIVFTGTDHKQCPLCKALKQLGRNDVELNNLRAQIIELNRRLDEDRKM